MKQQDASATSPAVSNENNESGYFPPPFGHRPKVLKPIAG